MPLCVVSSFYTNTVNVCDTIGNVILPTAVSSSTTVVPTLCAGKSSFTWKPFHKSNNWLYCEMQWQWFTQSPLLLWRWLEGKGCLCMWKELTGLMLSCVITVSPVSKSKKMVTKRLCMTYSSKLSNWWIKFRLHFFFSPILNQCFDLLVRSWR